MQIYRSKEKRPTKFNTKTEKQGNDLYSPSFVFLSRLTFTISKSYVLIDLSNTGLFTGKHQQGIGYTHTHCET